MTDINAETAAEREFRTVFAHLPAVVAFARRRGSRDPEGVGAEVMSIAWRRLAVVPRSDPLPWLYTTARNLVLAEFRRDHRNEYAIGGRAVAAAEPIGDDLDPALAAALAALRPLDREALLLVAWEDLTPTQAARTLGIQPAAFRVRLLRARRRFRSQLEAASSSRAPAPAATCIDLEEA